MGKGVVLSVWYVLYITQEEHMSKERKTFRLELDAELHRDFKAICAMDDVTMQRQIYALMVAHVAKNASKLPEPE